MNITDIITESKHTCPDCGGPVVEYSELTEKKDACYYKIKASAKVWPSAYASGRLVQCRKKGAANYGNKNESQQQLDEKCWDGYQQQGMKKKGSRQVPNCVPKESVDEAAAAAQQAAIAIAKKKKKGVAEGFGRDDDDYHLLDVGPTRWYMFKDGRFFTFNVYPGEEKQAERDGYSRTQAEARQKSDQGTNEPGVAEADMGKHNNATTGFKALAKKAGGGEKGAKIAGAQFQKMKKAGQLESQAVAETKHQPRWEVEQHANGHHNAFYLVKGYDRPREVWKDARGRSDFKNRAAAEDKAAELNQQAVAEGSQPLFTPAILPCAKCGAKARLIDWDFKDHWRVMCDNNHAMKGENITKNRAVHKWNNLQNKLNGEQGVAETTGDPKFDKMLKGITGKKVVAKQQKTDTRQQSRDAFGGMFGGGNPADALSIRKKGVAEGWKNIVGAGTLALGALGAGVANATDQSNSQQYAQLADKYYNVLVQRAKEDGRELDTRTLNGLKSRALDAATKTMEKNKSQPPRGSDRRVAKDADQFESPGVAAKVQPIQELSSDALDRYKVKAKKSADDLTSLGKYRQANDRTMNVMKATGKQIDNTVTNIRKALNRESTNQDMAEDAEQLNVGDDVIITGDVQFNGATGVIDSFGRDNRFVVVNLYNYGRHSFHSSDVSFNDYADSDDEQARMYDAGEFRGHTDDDIMESRLQQMRDAGYDIL